MDTRSHTPVWWVVGSSLCLALVGVVIGATWWHQRSPLWAPFYLDPNRPFCIELGRGSGKQGLTTVRVEQDGTVTLHGLRRGRNKEEPEAYWVTATLRFPPERLAEVVDAVNDTKVLGLAREHHEPGVRDGRQWVLLVRQGEVEKAIYCDNRFPRAMLRFAQRLDDVLEAHGLLTVEWSRVPAGQERDHDRELWESIER